MNTELPSLPWKKVATDLFHWKSSTYLLIVDCYSRYIEISKLIGQSSSQVITHTKSIFAKSDDPYIALMIYRSTPLNNGFSPSQLLMNR